MRKLVVILEIICLVTLIDAGANGQRSQPRINPPPRIDPPRRIDPPPRIESTPRVNPPPPRIDPAQRRIDPPPRIESAPRINPPSRVELEPRLNPEPKNSSQPSPPITGSTDSPPPPPPPRARNSFVLPYPGDEEQTMLEQMIRRYNTDESLSEYWDSVKRARRIVNTANEVVFLITAIDPYRQLAKMVVKRLEKEAVAIVHRRLAAQLARIEARVQNWGIVDTRYTRLQKEIALAELRKCDQWLNNVTSQAIYEANTLRNQRSTSENDNFAPVASITIDTSSAASTSRIQWREGLAMRQLRDVNRNGWSRVLNEER